MDEEPLTNRECRLLWALEVAVSHIAVYPRFSDPKVKQALAILDEVSALLDVPTEGDGESRSSNVIHLAEYVLLKQGASDGDGHPDGDGDGHG